MVPKSTGPGAAWSASQLLSERDENIYDLRGAHSFPTLEDEGEQCMYRNIYSDKDNQRINPNHSFTRE